MRILEQWQSGWVLHKICWCVWWDERSGWKGNRLETEINQMDASAKGNEAIFTEVDLSGWNEVGERKNW